MIHGQLVEELRAHPGDRARREVFADALLTAGDARGELIATTLAGQPVPEALLERCLEPVRAAAPGVTRVRFEGGLVSELELPFEAIAHVDLARLAREPLVRITSSLPGEDTQLDAPLAKATAVLGACRGFGFLTRISDTQWPQVCELITETEPSALDLDLGVDRDSLESAPRWPSVKMLRLSVKDPTSTAGLLRASFPALRGLQLRHAGIRECLLAAPELEHLDLRGVTLEPDELDALEVWLRERPGRTLRHERFELGPPDLDDVFGERGLFWEAEPPLRTRITAVPGQSLSFAVARGTELQLYLRDEPTWRRELDAPASALAARADALLVGRVDGRVEAHGLDDERVDTIAALPGTITGLHARGEDLCVTFEGGWWLARGDRVEQGSEPVAALILTSTGTARALGTQVIVSGETERVVDLGEPVTALAAEGDVLFALAGRLVWRIHGAELEVVGSRARGGRPALACHGGCVAWTHTRSSASFLRGGVENSVAYPGSYSHSQTDELALADLCVLDSDTIVTALEHGGMNLLTPDGALKADEFPREPRRRWIFVYGGQILIAG